MRWFALALTLLASPAWAQTASVCLDAGHGGHDPGAVGNGINEKDVNLDAVLAARDWMQLDTSDNGGGGSWDVYLTRDTDIYVSLTGRCDYANSNGVDYFMCIHANAGGGDGTETYAYASGTEADDLAHRVNEEVVDHLGTNDRGVKYASFTVLVSTSMPADLNEMAFLDTWAGNAELLSDPANLDRVGLAHLHAIQRHNGLTAYTPTGTGPDEPTGTVEVTVYPSVVTVDETFEVVVDYDTDLHEFGEVGYLAVAMKDADTWDPIHESSWDNGGAGIAGPSGDHSFTFIAPPDPGEVFFVAWLSPQGGSYADRLDDHSTINDPTGVTDPAGDDDDASDDDTAMPDDDTEIPDDDTADDDTGDDDSFLPPPLGAAGADDDQGCGGCGVGEAGTPSAALCLALLGLAVVFRRLR